MSRFTLDFNDEERDALEAHRIRLGCRSGAETIRTLLLSKTASEKLFAYANTLSDHSRQK